MPLYPYQEAVAGAILHHFKTNKFVILDAPPGTGKTFIGHEIMDKMSDNRNHTLYSCHSKALQRQFIEDFPDTAVMYGRSNYQTELVPELTTEDCLGKECNYCNICPYKVAKRDFVQAPMGMTNISYFLAESNYVNEINTSLIIVDEADKLEDALLSFAELSLNERNLRLKYHIYPPSRKTVESSWLTWAESTYEKMRQTQRILSHQVDHSTDPLLAKELKYVNGLVSKLRLLTDPALGIPSGNWVYDGYNESMIKFRPIRVATLAQDLIWKHVDKALLMSGTVISASVMADSVGIDDFEEVTLPSRFPAENRPVHIRPIVKMNAKSENSDFDLLAREIEAILDKHPGRVLVHTVSYRYAQELMNRVRSNRLITYNKSSEVESAIGKYLANPDSVMIASSLSRGISFSYDQCDVIIIVKVPYLSLGDKQVSARLYSAGGQLWYTVSAIRELVQMTGRGMRAADDKCVTYILDAGFNDLYYKRGNGRFFPKWWKDAIVMDKAGQ